MKLRKALPLLSVILFLGGFSSAGLGHEPSGGHEAPHVDGNKAMEFQHRRMAAFRSAAMTLAEAIINNDAKKAQEGSAQLLASLEGHEKDVPHKNRHRAREFHGLYVVLGNKTRDMQSAIRAGDIPKTAAEYGKVLGVCAGCHRIFRDG